MCMDCEHIDSEMHSSDSCKGTLGSPKQRIRLSNDRNNFRSNNGLQLAVECRIHNDWNKDRSIALEHSYPADPARNDLK